MRNAPLDTLMNLTLVITGSLSFMACQAATPDTSWPFRDDDSSPGPYGPGPSEGEGEGEGEGEAEPQCPAVGGIPYERPKPNVVLLVDRSGSMAEPGACADATCPSKWQQLLALGGYLEDIKTHARLGLSVFPANGQDGCNVTAGEMVPVTDAPDVDQMILNAVASIGPNGMTPIAQALDEVAAFGGLDDPNRDNIIVLLTDGMPNCSCTDDLACEQQRAVEAVQRLVNRDIPIRLNVVGFGASAATASETLSAMAVAAGTAIPGPTAYYQANTVEDLVQRLYQVAAGLAPCRFNLDQAPESDSLKVWLDDGLVAPCTDASCDSGYTYDAANGVVELHGSSCQAIRDGQCHNVWFDTSASE